MYHRSLICQYIFSVFNSVSHVTPNVVVVSLESNHQIAALNGSRECVPEPLDGSTEPAVTHEAKDQENSCLVSG
jgi:hypothetical protein